MVWLKPDKILASFTDRTFARGKMKIRGNHGLVRRFFLAALVVCFIYSADFPLRVVSQTPAPPPSEPTNPKAQKTFAEASDWQKRGYKLQAMDSFRKANTQNGGHCAVCLSRAYVLALDMRDYKLAEAILRDWLPMASTDTARAALHLRLGTALQVQAQRAKGDKQRDLLSKSCDEYRTALSLDPSAVESHVGIGVDLAWLHQDDAARAEFRTFLHQDKNDSVTRARVTRYVDRVDLARSRMAPAFALTTMDGQHITIDGLAGKVVLIDFWATWCGPCREALPHIREVAKKFQGQPLVVLSVSLDTDDTKWKDFVANNGMTWLQYRDGRFDGPMAKLFSVDAIPAIFSIDADGVLEDQHVGDGSIEGKLKKMIAHAVQVENAKSAPATSQAPAMAN